MIRRMVQRGLALGLTGMLGMMFIAGPASGLPAQSEPESIKPAGSEEGQRERDLTPEEQEAMRAWVAAMAEASPMSDRPNFKKCMPEPYDCPASTTACAFKEGQASCSVIDCGEGACRSCPEILSKMFIKAWCSYSCMRGAEIIGGAFILKPRTGGESGPWCIDKNGNLL